MSDSVDDILNKKVEYSEKAPYVSVDKVDIWKDAVIEAYNNACFQMESLLRKHI